MSSVIETPESEIWLGSMEIPDYVKDLMVLDALDKTPDEVRTNLQRTNPDGTTDTIPVMRIPLVDIGYPNQSDAEDAILSAMGYLERN